MIASEYQRSQITRTKSGYVHLNGIGEDELPIRKVTRTNMASKEGDDLIIDLLKRKLPTEYIRNELVKNKLVPEKSRWQQVDQRIYRVRDREGINLSPKSNELRNNLIKLNDEGLSYLEIADRLNLSSPGKVRELFNRFGIKVNKGGKQCQH